LRIENVKTASPEVPRTDESTQGGSVPPPHRHRGAARPP